MIFEKIHKQDIYFENVHFHSLHFPRIIENVHEIKKVHETSYVRSVKLPEEKFFCRCDARISALELHDTSDNDEDNKEWDKLIKMSPQKQQGSDPFEAVPSIAIVPPTPDGSHSQNSHSKLHLHDLKSLPKTNSKDSPEDESPQCDEPPYHSMSTSGLKRYGTMSSLERLPSEETDKYNSSDEDGGNDADDDEIKIITKEVYENTEEAANQPLRNWTSRAGSYVAEKMSFFEESRAFFDKYLGRWDKPEDNMNDEDHIEDCTSGATSGEDVWGTPTSGGENDEIQMFNSDHTHSVNDLKTDWNQIRFQNCLFLSVTHFLLLHRR